MSRRDDLKVHLFRLVHLARSAHLTRVLSEVDPDPALNFWRLILGNHLDISVLEWCKVFGSDAEATHWKQIIPAIEQDQFRADLLDALGFSAEEWTAYWDSIKEYRDKQIAHYEELPPGSTYPELEPALRSCYFYYQYLVSELRAPGETKYPDDLEAYCNDFAQQTRQIVEQAVDATADIEEKVR